MGPINCSLPSLSAMAIRTLVLALVGVGFSAFGAATPVDGQSIKDIPAPGKLVDIGGYRLHVHCLGTGNPTVVIDAGVGSWSSGWSQVQESLAAQTRVCTYDRAGMGWSEASTRERTAAVMAEELHALLRGANLSPPYVLVGHSYGGYNVRAFAQAHPADVAGVALVESAHEDQWIRLPPEVKEYVDASVVRLEQAREMATAGMLTPDLLPKDEYFGSTAALQAAYDAELTAPEHYTEVIATLGALDETSRQVRSAGSLGDVPLLVISAGNSFGAFADAPLPHAESNDEWRDLQRELVSLSPNVEHVVVESATHAIHWTHPEVVTKGISRLLRRLEATRLPGVLPPSATPEIDRLLGRLENAYAAQDVKAFVALFTDDFVQHDVNRRVIVQGLADWTRQTRTINEAHRELTRTHGGRVRAGDWIIVETTWTGTIRGEALGTAGRDRSYNYSGIVMMQLVEGKIRRQLIYADHVTLTDQVGPLP